MADRIVLLGQGRVLAEGTPQMIKSRVAGKRLRCRTRLSLAELAACPEVDAVQQQGELVEIRSSQPEQLLRRLLAADGNLSDLELSPLSLEEAFLSLTATTTLEQAA
jgi:ABC-2 type transport system ATP-binding protein